MLSPMSWLHLVRKHGERSATRLLLAEHRLIALNLPARIKVVRHIGSGAFSSVFFCEPAAALKISHHSAMRAADAAATAAEADPASKSTPRRLGSIAHETAVLRALGSHEYVCNLMTSGSHWMCLAWCDCGDLCDHMMKFGPILPKSWLDAETSSEYSEDVKLFFRIAYEIASALAHCHASLVVHLDVKPDNILLRSSADGLHVRLTDFGLARNLVPGQRLLLTSGSMPYVSPEIGTYVIGPEVDAWSLGCTIYTLATGEFLLSDHEISSKSWHHAFERAIKLPTPVARIVSPLITRNLMFRASVGKARVALSHELRKPDQNDPPLSSHHILGASCKICAAAPLALIHSLGFTDAEISAATAQARETLCTELMHIYPSRTPPHRHHHHRKERHHSTGREKFRLHPSPLF